VRTNDAGIEIIKRYEGFRARPYLCPAGVWTIGYGHTGGVNNRTPPVTEAEAEELLRRDLRDAEKVVTSMVTVPLNDNQFSALVSFAFNVGAANLRTSTLRARVNAKQFFQAAAEFGRWVYATDPVTGRKVQLGGLTKRREEERGLFLRPAVAADNARFGV